MIIEIHEAIESISKSMERVLTLKEQESLKSGLRSYAQTLLNEIDYRVRIVQRSVQK